MASRCLLSAALALLFLGAGCSPRDHDNIFDPENPDTGGNPDIFAAIAADGRVRLDWGLPDFADLTGFAIRRTDGAGGDVVLAEGLGPDVRTFLDLDVTNDSTYAYTLSTFFAGQAEPVNSAPSNATPGRRVIWILDQNTGNPTPVSPDARHRLARPGGTRIPSDLDVFPRTGDVVTVDFFEKKIDRYDRNGTPVASITTDGQPLSVAVDPADTTVWAGTFNPSHLTRWSPTLTVAVSVDTGMGVPEDIALDSGRGDVWVADSEGRLIHRRPDASIAIIAGFDRPFSVAVDAASGDCWMADRSGVVYRVGRDADTVLVRNEAFAAPFQVISDGGGGAWVTDSAAGRIVHLDAAGTVIDALTDLRNPGGLARDPASTDLWVTELRGDELVRLDPGGGVLTRLGSFNGPFEVRVTVPER